MKSKLFFLSLFTAAILFSCKKDKDSKPIVSVYPDPMYIYGNVNDLISFRITIDSDVRLSRFSITIQPDNQTPFKIYDTVLNTKGAVIYYYYRLPLAYAGKSIIFNFKADDENGNSGSDLKRVFVNLTSAVSLTETAGHRIYSNLSTQPDAYDLETNSPQFSTVGDSTLRDIQDMSGTDTTLSRSWKSPAGGKFVLFNGFDYANATDSSVYNAYVAGVKLTLLNNIQVGDIVITKLGSVSTNKYVLMRITDIIDAPGKNGDYYEFTIKK